MKIKAPKACEDLERQSYLKFKPLRVLMKGSIE